MSDVAQILGIDPRNQPPPPAPATNQPSRAMKLQSVPKEVVDLVGGELPTIVPDPNKITKGSKEGTVKIGNKYISKDKPARKWAWAPFSSSSRTDGAVFHHWVRANVEYPDYPYARFDIHLDPISYTDEEYSKLLNSDTWTKSETDHLMELAKTFELRWPVIHDRWIEHYQNLDKDGDFKMKKVEDLQHRYYHVAALLTQYRISQEAGLEAKHLNAAAAREENKARAETLVLETAAAKALAVGDPTHQPYAQNIGTGSSNKIYDLKQERERRAHLESLWNQTKEEEIEEAALRKELKDIDAQLRKIKKNGGHIVAAAKKGVGLANISRTGSPVPSPDATSAVLNEAFASTAPKPTPRYPYLQSARLVPPGAGGSTGLNKSLLKRMEVVLDEMKVPAQPIATKRVCDMYDTVRKDLLTLLILQKNVLQKEGIIQTKRMRLSKLGADISALDEEALLGIAPAPAAPEHRASSEKSEHSKIAASKSVASKTVASKKAPSSSSKGKNLAAVSAAAAKSANDADKKKAATKRKRKETKSPQPDSEDKKKRKKG